MKFLAESWCVCALGIAATGYCVKRAYEIRGYFAVGGEWMVFPLVLMAAYMIRELLKFLSTMFLSGSCGDSKEHCRKRGR